MGNLGTASAGWQDEFPATLRARPEDIRVLAGYFIQYFGSKGAKQFRSIERNTLEWLEAYHWPGNIRELQNVVERAVILCDGEVFSIDQSCRREGRGASKAPVALAATLIRQERGMIEAALRGEPQPDL